MQAENSQDPKKIVLMGLDNSGKTSLVLCLKGVNNLSSFSALKPTRGFEINKFYTLDTEFSIWDFGGQEKFREGYFTNFQDHIQGASKLIYVIDVQDKDRYEISLEYLTKIITLLKKQKFNLEFSIFLHKFDPDMEIMKKEIKDEVIKTLVKQIEKIFPSDFPYQIYKTSIYTVFQKITL
ncbi:MAG: ADP-ribosylation factor-like protein [Candidatus Hermodarchaeota archaeon]